MDRKSHFTFFHTDFVESDCFTWVKNFTWFVSACSITIIMQNESHILHGFAVCSGYLTFVCAFISLAFKTWIYRTRTIYGDTIYMVLQIVAVGYLPLVCVHRFSQCLHGFTVSSCWLVLAILQGNHLRRSKLGQRQHPVIPVLTMQVSFCCGPNMKVLEVSSSSPSSSSPSPSSSLSWNRSLPSPRPCQAWLHQEVHRPLFSCFL